MVATADLSFSLRAWIGGEWPWAPSLLSGDMPKKWGPWVAATLQSGVNLGVCWRASPVIFFQNSNPRWIFLSASCGATDAVGSGAPCRTGEWQRARGHVRPGTRIMDLFADPCAPPRSK